MAAKHKREEEYRDTFFGDGQFDPTPEAYGDCGVCFGGGTVPSCEKNTHPETCWNCGGDGKSELIEEDTKR